MNISKTSVRLSGSDLEHLLIACEKSLEIQNRSQLFLWARGALHGFIAHDALWCGYGDIEANRLKVISFAGTLSSPVMTAKVNDPVDGLLPRLVDDWLQNRRRPLTLGGEGSVHISRLQLIADLKRCGLDHALAHGVGEIQGDHGSFFVFAGSSASTERESYLFDLLLPYMHLALQRVRQYEDQRNIPPPLTVLLSQREVQVLHWVKHGKTNPEIGQILGISAPTVKHHLKKLMRKLNVTNRAQAVGKGATLRLLAYPDKD
jgi:transcriptional regulator EpsA